MKIHILHENEAWAAPLYEALEARGLPYASWFLHEGRFDLSEAPPEGVFYNRMSASSHTRDHRYAAEYTAAVLAWLEGHGRRVVNSSRALQLEVSKVAQYAALEAAGIRTPRTVVAAGRDEVAAAADAFAPGPVILKPNRGGKGLGVQRFETPEALRAHVAGNAFEPSIDGLYLLQDYVPPADDSIVRAEYIGGRFFYAVRVDTSNGFLLCPADACAPEDAFCPTGEGEQRAAFEILPGFQHPLLAAHERFLAANGIEVAGVEFITNAAGEVYTYDVNTNTNYNPDAEARAGLSGMGGIADFLGAELARLQGDRARARGAA